MFKDITSSADHTVVDFREAKTAILITYFNSTKKSTPTIQNPVITILTMTQSLKIDFTLGVLSVLSNYILRLFILVA